MRTSEHSPPRRFNLSYFNAMHWVYICRCHVAYVWCYGIVSDAAMRVSGSGVNGMEWDKARLHSFWRRLMNVIINSIDV